MKMTVDRATFLNQFKAFGREDNFSRWALNELFDYFEQCEADCGEEMEMDVIAICCDYNEYSFDEIRNEYLDCKEMTDEEIIEHLNDHTQVVAHDDENVIFAAF